MRLGGASILVLGMLAWIQIGGIESDACAGVNAAGVNSRGLTASSHAAIAANSNGTNANGNDSSGPSSAAHSSTPAFVGRQILDGLLSPQIDLLLLMAMGWWFWKLQKREVDEERIFKSGSLRAVTYPSEAHAKGLLRFKEQWCEEFRNVQCAWARRDLRPVYGIIGPEIRRELEGQSRHLRHGQMTDRFRLTLDVCDPVDSWREDGREFVTLHFSGLLEWRAEEEVSRAFDEFWTFSRDLSDTGPEARPLKNLSWMVRSIRRGDRERSIPRLA